MSQGWSLFVIIGTVVTLIASFWLIYWSGSQGPEPTEDSTDTGHTWDGLTENNFPLPRWWLWLFILTLIYSAAYMIYYPGFGNYAGLATWSQEGQYDQEMAVAEARYGPLFAGLAALPPEKVVTDTEALGVGKSLFANYCSQCHGSLGYGGPSFPNLTDDDWLYGGTLEAIEASILNGRQGVMPPLGAVFADEAALDAMVGYVQNLSAGPDTESPAHAQYLGLCSACHGPAGDGLQALGAPRLNDDIWLYGSSDQAIRNAIVNGLNGNMPAHRALIGEDRARLLAAYVYSLSADGAQ